VVGRDVLLESGTDLLQPLTLEIGRCASCCGANGSVLNELGMFRVATEIPVHCRQSIGTRGQRWRSSSFQDRWNWPGLGLADCIVDLVESGRTLRENDLKN